jgi:hypothetical protein
VPAFSGALTAAWNPSALDRTTINFSLLSWAVGPPGQEARNQARKARTSLKPAIKVGVLLGRCPAGKQVLATWAFEVVPSGLSLRGLDMSLDMHLLSVSVETVGSDRSKSMAVALSGPLVCYGATGQANRAAYITPPSGDPSYLLSKAACSPVAEENAGRGTDPAAGAGRLLAGSIESLKLVNFLALCLPASWLEALGPPPCPVL